MSQQSGNMPPFKKAKDISASSDVKASSQEVKASSQEVKASSPEVNGYFFSFNVEKTENDALHGKYNDPVFEKINVSTYGMKNPKGIRDFFRANFSDTRNLYMLGVKYKGSGKNPDDSQPTITGKTKGSEKFHEGAMRELSEEIGAFCDLSSTVPITSVDRRNTEFNTYIVPVRNLTPLEKVSKPVGEDNFKKRVEIVVYGTIDEIKDCMREIRMRHCEETDIMGIMAFPVDFAK